MFREEIIWAAGLFEGEGSLSSVDRPYGHRVMARLTTTDLDVLERFAAAVRCGRIQRPYLPKKGKVLHSWQCATLEGVQSVIAAFWPWLGNRRRAKAVAVLMFAREKFTRLGYGIERHRVA